MRSTRRSRLAALSVFVLIAGVVVGGMAWATASSFQLARKQVTEEHERLVRRAVGLIDNHISGILAREGSRDHTHYLRMHSPQNVVAVYTPRGEELDAAAVVLRSPLAGSELPEEWMDLFFQWNPSSRGPGALSSPQLEAEHELWSLELLSSFPAAERKARITLEWLKGVLPEVDLHAQVAEVCRFHDEIEAVPPPAPRLVSARTQRAAPAVHREYHQRKKSLRDSQGSYLPPEDCVDARHVRDVLDAAPGQTDDRVPPVPGDVSLTVDPFTAFWLGTGPDGNPKLGFVRECHMGELVFYQGFVGDWGQLKPALLRIVQHLFPDADLAPVPEDGTRTERVFESDLINLPVTLQVPGFAGGAGAIAWARVRSAVLSMWVTAAAVLIVAGWGLRSLVALTERRMRFAYAVTHELRTPLTTFRLYTDMLSAGLVPADSRQAYVETLHRESQRLSSLVEGVLEYARLENRKVRLNPVETNGAALLGAVSETLQKLCRDHGISGQTENTLHNGRKLTTDVDVVRRIADVLLSNACRYARSRNGATVLVRLCDQDEQVHLDVIDSGPGVDRADVRAIFKPFRRGRRADQHAQGGIGLGLALARSWADLLGGRLELAARHHPTLGGAHFRLTIPRCAAS